jgi:hypothetical protein
MPDTREKRARDGGHSLPYIVMLDADFGILEYDNYVFLSSGCLPKMVPFPGMSVLEI